MSNHRYRYLHRAAVVALVGASLFHLPNARCVAQPVPQREPPTVAESSGFTATATGEQVRNFLTTIATNWENTKLTSIGKTVEGRDIDTLIVSGFIDFSEEAIENDELEPLTVLILGGIHSGECDGKEALMALARDWSQSSEDWVRKLNLILVPNFNADADARRGTEHRPGQDGPSAGMGLRENAQGLDLNRDFIKLESPEVRALVKTIHEHDVDVLIDLHTTNGSLHRYPLTYDIPHNPTAPASIDRYLRDELLPNISSELAQEGLDTFYYGNFNQAHDRWESYGHEPRYSTEYMGVRGKVGILVESYSYAPYSTRFEASYRFVDRLLRRLASDSERIRAMIDEQAKLNEVGTSVPIAGKLAQAADRIHVLGYQTSDGKPPADPYLEKPASDLRPKDYSVELWNRAEATRHATLPMAYAIEPQHAWVVSRLQHHGLVLAQLSRDEELDTEWANITGVATESTFQGHRPKSLEVQWQTGKRVLPQGTYIVVGAEELGRLAAILLEPLSEESLATWNFFDPYLSVGAEYPVLRLPKIPENLESVSSVAPGELLTFDRVMKPGETIDLGGGNRFQMIRWSAESETPEYIFQKDQLGYAADAETGATRRLEKKRQPAGGTSHLPPGHPPIESGGESRQGESRQMAEPNSTGSHVAFVRDNNLWIEDSESKTETPITDNGSTELLNGILDWVYQEELYGRGNFKAFWWSPDGRFIAYLQLDQAEVPEYIVLDSAGVEQTVERTRYPKSGDPNPKVKVFVVDVSNKWTREIPLSEFAEEDRLVGRVSWSPDNQVWLQVFNRVQNRQLVVRFDPKTEISKVILSEDSKGWIEIRGTPTFLKDGNFLWLSDLPDGRTHLYLVDASTGNRRPLTSGDWDVAEVLSVSKDEKAVFVSGNPDQPIEKHLVVVDVVAGTYRRVTELGATHDVSVDPTGRFFIDHSSSLTSLPTTKLHRTSGEFVRSLSVPTSDRHQFVKMQAPKLLTIPARDGVPLQTQVMLPWGVEFDAASEHNKTPQKKLPVLFYVYAGPQAPTVQNSWRQRDGLWHQLLCTKGYAVVLCDNRSARGRGVADSWTIRGELGRVELHDLEDAVAWVSKQPWADPERVGIWGWSYGGYMTAYALTHSKLFKAGIAGAPVTDWRHYDSIYTERYMDLPEANKDGYQSSSVVEAAGNLHGRLLLIHGERDDNVHLSNTLQLAGALQSAGKQFDLMIYPRARHSVVDPRQRYQMYQMMTEFLEKNLKE